MNDDIKVSVLCLTYNHEKYIRQCLDGFIMQKTNFPFEVIVHDDASTDNTAAIVREYEEKYPDIIKPIYETENQYSKGVRITSTIMFPKAKGKYLAFCEGDDFWVDPLKLQKQYDAMEANPDCHMCVCKVRCVDESGVNNIRHYPGISVTHGKISGDFLIKNSIINYEFHTSGYFVKKCDYNNLIYENPAFAQACPAGDRTILFYFGQLGNVYYLSEVLSCYRRLNFGNWSTINSSNNNQIEIKRKFITTISLYDIYTKYRFHNYCQNGIHSREFDILLIEKEYLKALSPKYWKFSSFKSKLKILSQALFPKLMQKYESRKKQKHEQQ